MKGLGLAAICSGLRAGDSNYSCSLCSPLPSFWCIGATLPVVSRISGETPSGVLTNFELHTCSPAMSNACITRFNNLNRIIQLQSFYTLAYPCSTSIRLSQEPSSFVLSSSTNGNNNLTSGAYKQIGEIMGDSDGDYEYGDSDNDFEGVLHLVEVEVEKTGNNRRRIQSKISMKTSLDRVWNILTDYEGLAEFIPGLAVSQLLEKKDNIARLFQIGQQNLAFGLKFEAKGVIECCEGELENLPLCQRRNIGFQMIKGDFQLFEGTWSIEQTNIGESEEANSVSGDQFSTTLSYVVDVEPKVWLPVRLVEGRLCREIKMNLLSIKRVAEQTQS